MGKLWLLINCSKMLDNSMYIFCKFEVKCHRIYYQYLQILRIFHGKVHCHLISYSSVWPSINKLCSSTSTSAVASFSTKASAVSLSMEKVEVFFKDRVLLHSVQIQEIFCFLDFTWILLYRIEWFCWIESP